MLRVKTSEFDHVVTQQTTIARIVVVKEPNEDSSIKLEEPALEKMLDESILLEIG